MISVKRNLSVSSIIFIIIFVLIALSPRFEDPDFYWHLKTGEYIVSIGGLPRHDIFTFTNYGHELVLSEWLSQLVFYALFQVTGFGGVGVFVAIVYVMCWFITYLTCRDVLKDEGKAAIVTLLFCAIMWVVAPRPHIFTFLLFSLLLRQLFLFKYFNSEQGLKFIPLGMMLWANLHGGFFIGLVLMFVFIMSEWAKLLWYGTISKNNLIRMRRISLIAFLGLLATAINPDGFHYWLYPYEAIVSSGDANFISEWQSPNFHKPLLQYFLIAVIVFFLGLVYSRRKPDLAEISVPMVFIIGAFVAVRNLPLAALAMAPFFAVFCKELFLEDGMLHKEESSGNDHFERSAVSAALSRVLSAGNKPLGGEEWVINWIILIMSLISILLLYPSRKMYIEASMSSLLPIKAANFVVDNQIQGRMLNTYHFGGYLIYRLHPWQKVFIYGRTDIYKKGFIDEYQEIYRGGERWKALFEKNNIDYVVCESAAPLRQLLLAGGKFKMVFNDGKHSILLRDDKKYRNLINKYALRVD